MTDNRKFGFGVDVESDEAGGIDFATHSLFELLLGSGALKFGEFQLKSGRISPYFMNFGNIRTGKASSILGVLYASCIMREFGDGFDVVFGPSYKGIPLATHAAAGLSDLGTDYEWAFNRKEAKDHGEGGVIVGADLKGKRVLIVDDVITAGTALNEAVEIIRAAGGIPVAAALGFDRAEKGRESDLSAVQEARKKYGIPVFAIATLDDLLAYLEKIPAESGDDVSGERIESIKAYRAQYGADYSLS